MRKFTIDSTAFELPDDAAIVLSAYLDRLDFYVAKHRIDADAAARAREYLKGLLLEHLSSGTPLSGKEAQNLANRTEREYPSAPSTVRPGIASRFFSGIASVFVGLFRALVFLVWASWQAVRWVVLSTSVLMFFISAAGVAWALSVLLIDPVVGGQAIFGALPRDISVWSLVALEGALVALALASFFALCGSPRLWRWCLVVGILSGFAAFNAIVYVGMDMFYLYSPRYERVETTRFAGGTGTGERTESGVRAMERWQHGEYYWYYSGVTHSPEDSGTVGTGSVVSYDYSDVQRRSDMERPFFGERIFIPSRSVSVEYVGSGSDVEIVTVTSVGAPDLSSATRYLADIPAMTYSLSGTTISAMTDNTSQERVLPYQGLYRRIYIRLPESAKPPERMPEEEHEENTDELPADAPGPDEPPVVPDVSYPTDAETSPDTPEYDLPDMDPVPPSPDR